MMALGFGIFFGRRAFRFRAPVMAIVVVISSVPKCSIEFRNRIQK